MRSCLCSVARTQQDGTRRKNFNVTEGEREQQQGAIRAKLKAGMMDAVLTLCNQRLRVKENTNQPEEFRYYRAVRARFMRHLSECLKPENGGVIRDVIWELRVLSSAHGTTKTGFTMSIAIARQRKDC